MPQVSSALVSFWLDDAKCTQGFVVNQMRNAVEFIALAAIGATNQVRCLTHAARSLAALEAEITAMRASITKELARVGQSVE